MVRSQRTPIQKNALLDGLCNECEIHIPFILQTMGSRRSKKNRYRYCQRFSVDIQVSDKPTKGISFCSFVKSNWNLSGIEKETPDLQEKLDELVSENYSIFSVTGCAATGANSEEYNPYVEISWKRRGANHEELKQNIMTITESDLSALFAEMMIKFANVPKTG